MNLSPGKNIRIFKHPFLEQFTYVHPLLPITLWGSIAIYCFSAGIVGEDISLMSSLQFAATGVFVWTIAEYLLHRFIFHFKPHGHLQERLAFIIHGIHHEDPEDARRLLMPPVAAIILAMIFYTIFAVCFGAVNCKPFFSGFLVGYLAYDYTHFAVHFMKPRNRFMKALKHNHMLHHFVTPDKRYGVSNVLWDYIFGTRG